LGLKRRNYVVLIAMVLIMSLLAVGCGGSQDQNAGQDAADSDVIKIGVFEPLTGVNAAGGQMTLEGIELAKEMYPEILGKKVEIVTVDNKSEKQEAANAVENRVGCSCSSLLQQHPSHRTVRTGLVYGSWQTLSFVIE
jgi:branched-chain amino acid transport system substrate-binding protein